MSEYSVSPVSGTNVNDTIVVLTDKKGAVALVGTSGTVLQLPSVSGNLSSPGGSTAQLQINNAGVLGGIPWTYDATHNQLALRGVADQNDVPAILIDRGGGVGGGILVRNCSSSDYGNVTIAVSSPAPDIQGVNDVRAIFDNQGCLWSNANLFITGAFNAYSDSNGKITVTNRGLGLLPADLQPTAFVGFMADQADSVCISSLGGGSRFITCVDGNQKYVWSVDGGSGRLTWGGNVATRAAMDVGLGRTAAGTLSVGNGTEGDASGTLAASTLTASNVNASTITFPDGAQSISLRLDHQYVWTSRHTFSGNLTLGTGSAIQAPDQSSIISQSGSSPNFVTNFQAPNYMQLTVPTGYNGTFVSGAVKPFCAASRSSNTLPSMQIGGNHCTNLGLLFIKDEVAATGDTLVSIQDGAAGAARVNFGPWASNGTYATDVGFARSAAGQLSIHDGSTTLTNYRDLKLRQSFHAAGTTAQAQINLAAGTAPTSPNDGDIWYDGTNIKIQVGATTKTFTII